MSALPRWLLVIHVVILVNFLLQVFYGAWMVFVVTAPEGSTGLPLFGAAQSLGFEAMMIRREYANETWVAISGLSVYVGVTEVLPRRLGRGAG